MIDGLPTRYEVSGTGPPLLLFSPGGFDATLDNWATHGVYRRTSLIPKLAEHYTCIAFDRRESGSSGGRVERVTWAHYAAQGKGLLDHLGIERAHLLGGCVGCSVATTFAVAYPERRRRDGAVLPGRRGPLPAGPARSLRSTRRVRSRARAPAGGGPGEELPGRIQRGPARRAVGAGDPHATPTSPRATPPRTPSATSWCLPAWPGGCSTATPCPAPSPRTCSCSTSPRWSCPVRTRRTRRRRPGSCTSASQAPSTGTSQWRSKPQKPPLTRVLRFLGQVRIQEGVS